MQADAPTIFTGSCACGVTRYRIEGELGRIVNCHCSKCRKWHGAAFRTGVAVAQQNFSWVSGESLLSQWQSSENGTAKFCSRCGSSLVTFRKNRPGVVAVALGTFNEDPGRGPEFHIFVGSKAPWHQILDDLPQYDEWPDDHDAVHQVRRD